MKTTMTGTTTSVDWTMFSEFYRAWDSRDASRMADCFTTREPICRIGNASPAIGWDALTRMCKDLMSKYQTMHTELIERWATADAIIIEGVRTYSKDGKTEKSMPFVDVIRMRDGKIAECCTYAECTDLMR